MAQRKMSWLVVRCLHARNWWRNPKHCDHLQYPFDFLLISFDAYWFPVETFWFPSGSYWFLLMSFWFPSNFLMISFGFLWISGWDLLMSWWCLPSPTLAFSFPVHFLVRPLPTPLTYLRGTFVRSFRIDGTTHSIPFLPFPFYPKSWQNLQSSNQEVRVS